MRGLKLFKLVVVAVHLNVILAIHSSVKINFDAAIGNNWAFATTVCKDSSAQVVHVWTEKIENTDCTYPFFN